VDFSDLSRDAELPPVYDKGQFVFESMDHGPQQIVTWGPPAGKNKLALHSGVIIHLPFPADRVRVQVASGGGLISAIAFNSGGAVVGQAVTQPGSGVQTLEITGSDITVLKVQGGKGEGVLVGVCAHPDDSGKPAANAGPAVQGGGIAAGISSMPTQKPRG
jgi:hypothetical protein